MLGTSRLYHYFSNKFNFKKWFSSKFTFRTWLIAVISCLVFGVVFWQFGNIKDIFYQASGADPVVYWKMDEGQGSTLNSSSGTINATIGPGNSAPTWVPEDQCVSGTCLFFDGTNDAIRIGTSMNSIGSTLGSVAFWFKSTKVISAQPEIIFYGSNCCAAGDGFGTDIEFNLGLDVNKKVQLYIYGSPAVNISSTSTYNDSEWHYVTATWNKPGGNVSIYVDGKLEATDTGSGISSFMFNFAGWIGQPDVASWRQFGGYIDEFKIYNYARTASQISADYASRGSVNGVSAQFGDSDIGRKLSNGLVGYWKMDETSWAGATAVTDSSGNMNSGTAVSGAGITAPGRFGNGGSFTGTGNYISVLNSTSLDISTNTVTLSAWVKPGSGNGYPNRIVDKQEGAFQMKYALYTGSDNYYFAVYTDSVYEISSTAGSLVAGQWSHVLGVYDGSTTKIYINGTLQGSSAVTGNIVSNSNGVTIGARFDGNHAFIGTIDEVRIYNRALDPSEVTALYQFAPGPVAYWKMDDGSGISTVDSSGIGNNGTFGTGTSAPTWANGKYGNGLIFDGTSDYISVSVGNTTSLNIAANGPLTLAAWVNTASFPTVNSTYRYIVGRGYSSSDGNESYLLRVRRTTGVNYLDVGTDSNAASWQISSWNTNEWHYVSGLYDGTTWRLYFDGVQVASTTSGGPNDNGVDVAIGARYCVSIFCDSGDNDFTRFWHGKIDEVKIYNYARTQAQITQDMNAGHPAPGSPVGSALAYYRLDEGYGTTIHNVGNAGSTLNGTFGTGTSAPTWTNDGKYGKGLVFDGSSDYVNIPSSTAWNLTDFTLSSWVYITAGQNTSWNNIIRKDNISESGTRKTFALRTSYNSGNDKPQFGMYDGTTESTASSPTALTTGWHHIVGVRNANSTLKLYVNGNLMVGSTDATVGAYDTATNVTLGGLHNSVYAFSEKFRGTIDEVKVYNFALTSDQVKVEYNQGKAQVMGAGSTGIGGTGSSFSAGREYCVPGDSSTCNAPIAEWKMDEGVGGTANDTSGNGIIGNFATGNSAPIWIKGKNGSGLSFNNSYVDLGLSTVGSRLNGNSVVTVSTWFKSLSFPANGARDRFLSISLDVGSTSGVFFGIFDDSGAIEVGGRSQASDSFQSGTVPFNTLGEWHFATGVIDYGSDTIKIYLDGQLKTNKSVTFGASIFTLGTPTFNDALGLMPGHGDEFTGYLDNLRIYSYERTPAQIAWEYNQGKPVAWYRLDECTGSTAYNAVKNGNGQAAGNNGTITIGASGTQTSTGTCSSGTSTQAWNNGTTGKFNSSLNFDGTDDYVSISDPSDGTLDFGTNDFSLQYWIKTTASGASKNVLEKRQNSATVNPGFAVGLNSSGTAFATIQDGTFKDTTSSLTSVNDGLWHNVINVFDRDTGLNVYVDGRLEKSEAITAVGSIDNATNLYIGRFFGGGGSSTYLLGTVDDVQIFNYALTSEQVKTNMAGGAIRFQ